MLCPQGDGNKHKAVEGGWRGVGRTQYSKHPPTKPWENRLMFPHEGTSTCDTCHIEGISTGPGKGKVNQHSVIFVPFLLFYQGPNPPEELGNQKEKGEIQKEKGEIQKKITHPQNEKGTGLERKTKTHPTSSSSSHKSG